MAATTLAETVVEDRVEFEELHRRYGPLLNLVNVLIGVVPYCDRYLEIWRPGFRTYNLMVPAFLDLPASLFGRSAPKDVVGLGMYTSSRAASCAYCSAHCCSYALRRGAGPEAVTGESRTPAEAAVVAVAEALSTDPHHYRPELGDELHRHFSADHAEWIVMAVAMMGFLNKFMDALGVELEPEAVSDVSSLIGPTGWSVGQHGWAGGTGWEGQAGRWTTPPRDSVRTMLRVVRNAPGAIRLEKQWTEGLPNETVDVQALLAETYGYDAEILSHLRHAKPRRAVSAMLRHNLDPEQTELGIGLKALVGLVYADYVGNTHLIERANSLAEHHGVDDASIKAAIGFFPGRAAADGLDDRTVAALSLARVMSPSPAMVDTETVELAKSALTSAEIIEVAVWISVSQLLHRLTVYYGIDTGSSTT